MTDILKEIATKIKPGQTSFYLDRNNTLDKKTIIDTENEFEKVARDQKNYIKLLYAIYENTGKKYIVVPKKGSKTVFIVSQNDKSSKVLPAFEVEVLFNNNTLVFKNLMDKKSTTLFEFGSVMDSSKDTDTKESQVQTLKKNLDDYEKKSPAELKKYLQSIIKNIK